MDGVDYISFGDYIRAAGLGQCQYVSRYVDGRHGYPKLSDDLRIEGDPADYHSLIIHKDDAPIFVMRVKQHDPEGRLS